MKWLVFFTMLALSCGDLLAESTTLYLTVYSSRTTAGMRNTMSKAGYVSTDTVHNFERTYFYSRGNTSYWMLEITPKNDKEKSYVALATGTGVAQLNAIAVKENAAEKSRQYTLAPFHPNIDRPYSMDRSTP